jgi:hypothetical protein
MRRWAVTAVLLASLLHVAAARAAPPEGGRSPFKVAFTAKRVAGHPNYAAITRITVIELVDSETVSVQCERCWRRAAGRLRRADISRSATVRGTRHVFKLPELIVTPQSKLDVDSSGTLYQQIRRYRLKPHQVDLDLIDKWCVWHTGKLLASCAEEAPLAARIEQCSPGFMQLEALDDATNSDNAVAYVTVTLYATPPGQSAPAVVDYSDRTALTSRAASFGFQLSGASGTVYSAVVNFEWSPLHSHRIIGSAERPVAGTCVVP